MSKRPLILLNSNFVPGKWPMYEVPATYYQAILEFGGLPVITPSKGNKEDILKLAQLADGFCFTGADDYPPELYGGKESESMDIMQKERAISDLILAKYALNSDKPIIGICAGHQLLHIAGGGQLIPDVKTDIKHTDEVYHDIEIYKNSRLEKIFESNQIIVNSYHHQAINPDSLSDRFHITAMAADGIVEAVENSDSQYILSLQWHPERIKFPKHRAKIFTSFIDEVIKKR